MSNWFTNFGIIMMVFAWVASAVVLFAQGVVDARGWYCLAGVILAASFLATLMTWA